MLEMALIAGFMWPIAAWLSPSPEWFNLVWFMLSYIAWKEDQPQKGNSL